MLINFWPNNIENNIVSVWLFRKSGRSGNELAASYNKDWMRQASSRKRVLSKGKKVRETPIHTVRRNEAGIDGNGMKGSETGL